MIFEKSVFINGPFDEEYFPLLKTLLFTIKKLNFIPRISLERNDSGKVRLNNKPSLNFISLLQFFFSNNYL